MESARCRWRGERGGGDSCLRVVSWREAPLRFLETGDNSGYNSTSSRTVRGQCVQDGACLRVVSRHTPSLGKSSCPRVVSCDNSCLRVVSCCQLGDNSEAGVSELSRTVPREVQLSKRCLLRQLGGASPHQHVGRTGGTFLALARTIFRLSTNSSNNLT